MAHRLDGGEAIEGWREIRKATAPMRTTAPSSSGTQLFPTQRPPTQVPLCEPRSRMATLSPYALAPSTRSSAWRAETVSAPTTRSAAARPITWTPGRSVWRAPAPWPATTASSKPAGSSRPRPAEPAAAAPAGTASTTEPRTSGVAESGTLRAHRDAVDEQTAAGLAQQLGKLGDQRRGPLQRHVDLTLPPTTAVDDQHPGRPVPPTDGRRRTPALRWPATPQPARHEPAISPFAQPPTGRNPP